MFIIAGLGNPGKEYENTRHNAGYLALDELAERYNISVTEKKFKSLVGKGVIEGQKVILLKPLTYMNLSGEAVALRTESTIVYSFRLFYFAVRPSTDCFRRGKFYLKRGKILNITHLRSPYCQSPVRPCRLIPDHVQ